MAIRTRKSPAKKKSFSEGKDPATAYAKLVVAGTVVAGPHVRAACRRHLKDLVEGPKRGLRWDLDAQHRVLKYFREVLHLNGGQFEGVPFEPQPWQCFILGSLFGWKKRDGYRRFDRAYIETGKGSGKSPLVAGIALYMMTSDKDPHTGLPEARAEIYAAAAQKDQAEVMFRDAVAMVDLSPKLAQRITKSGAPGKEYNLAYHKTASFFRPISSQRKGQSGPRPHCALLDEVHEHPNSDIIDLMIAGFKFRRQPLALMITNSGVDRQSVCYREHQQTVKVCHGEVEQDSRFGYICALDEGDDPITDPTCWPKGNPSLNVTIQGDYLQRQIDDARGLPDKLAEVKRLNFCVWGEKVNRFIDRELWESVQADLDLEEFRGKRAILSLDLSGKNDLTSATLAFPDEPELPCITEFWTPRDTMAKRAERDQVPYAVWAENGDIHATDGKSVDYGFVAKRVGEFAAMFELVELVYDRYRIADLRRELDAQGIDCHDFAADDEGNDKGGPGFALVPHGQGFVDFGPAVDALETRILNGDIRIAKSPVMNMCAANTVVTKSPAGDRKFDKSKATGRIDGMVTLAMAARRAGHVITASQSYLETEDILFL